MSKGKKAKIIAISILVGIVAIAIALAVMFFSSSAYGVYRDMDSDDFESAVSVYQSDVKDSFIQKMLLNTLLKDRVNEVAKEYEDGKSDFDATVAELDALDKMGFEGAKEKIDEITVSNEATNALEKADEYYENGDYENAISEYSKIPETDENYAEAQTKLDQAYENYINAIVDTITEYNNSGEYVEAIQQANTAYDVLPDDVDTTTLDTAKEESLTSYKTQIANEVTELITVSEYVEAFELIDEAILVDDNEYFQNLKTSTEGTYVESISTDVQKHLDNEDYISASRVIENALTVLPNNTALEDLKKEVSKETPTYLLDVCEPYASSGYQAYVNGELIKMGGTSYTNAFSLDEGNALFNIDSNYTTLSCIVGHCDGTEMRETTIKFYCDGVLKKEISMNAEDLPQKITIDITGVNQLKIESSAYWTNYGFANITVK